MIRNRRLIWQLYPPFLLITLLSLLAVSWYMSSFFRTFFLQRTETDLLTQANLLKIQIQSSLDAMPGAAVDRLCKSVTRGTATRLTVVLPNGRVVCDSVEDPTAMDNHGGRPEIRSALFGETGTAVRYSGTLHQRMMYVAIPVEKDGSLQAVVRTSLPVESIDRELRSIQIRIAGAGLLIAILASAVCLYVSRRISRPIEALKMGAERFADGDLSHRLRSPATVEIAGLAETMNRMATQLDSRIQTIVSQRNEMQAVLSSMMEGVIAIDREAHIIRVNRAAGDMLGFRPEQMHDRSIQEVIRSRELHDLIERTLSSGARAQGDIGVYENGEKTLSTHCTPLAAADGHRLGTLIVLDDVTTLRRLENMRRDFAANVSHEIKTPLTAIKGFVETLADGSIDDPDEARRFLKIIEKHVNRLTAILNDLIELSRIEREDEIQQLSSESCRLRGILTTAIQVCTDKAAEKQIDIDLDCDAATTVSVDPTLMEQAFVNLIDNAVKYSNPRSRVTIRAEAVSGKVRIRFSDQGIGIAKKHLPRLFERFYRVDKARSRKMGGTGLGLAIVKHIVQAHGGRIDVQSVLGEGTVFTIELPANRSV